MKNKNNVVNRTASELLNLIVKVRREAYNDGGVAGVDYAFASGVLVSLMDWELKGYDKSTSFQQHINECYNRYEKELDKLQAKKELDAIQKVANSAKLEELYA